ncbi:MAG: 4Fe-4S dicluster domain-containing protein, partial [Armatimonadota bacterium]
VAESNDVAVQAAVLLLNVVLDNVGRTVDLVRSSQQKMGQDAEMAGLIEEMQRGEVDVLLVHGCNPAYTYPDADEFKAALASVPCSVSFACTPDETAALTSWHCPADHPMEAWGDAEPQAGRFSLFQPTIRRLYDTRAFEDSLLKWSGSALTFHQYLKRHWEKHVFPRQSEFGDFETFWDAILQRGSLEVPSPQSPPSLKRSEAAAALKGLAPAAQGSGERLEVEVFESVALREGTAAGNAWLQELPDPSSKITWDNAAAIAPSRARDEEIAEGQLVRIETPRRTVEAPAHIQPGQDRSTISIALGYGRTHAGTVGTGVGVNAYPLVATRAGRRQNADAIDTLTPLEKSVALARTQIHSSMEGRPIVQESSHAAHQGGSAAQRHDPERDVSLWKEHEYGEYRWGMVIDLTKCIGCSACVTACDVENNVPVVGRDEVRRNREMHWIRIDRYFTGDPEAPHVVHQPMLCQQCANASCETVCPVLATVHDDQGLSVQVYNRCVGTRYCENN